MTFSGVSSPLIFFFIKMKNKKGQLGSLQNLILVLIIVGLLLGAGFFILDEFIDLTDNVAGSVTNETGASISEAGYTLGFTEAAGFNTPVIVDVYANATTANPYLVPAANYTVSSTGILTNASIIPDATEYNDANVSYTFLRGSTAFTGVNSTITAMLTIPNLLGLIVLIAMVGVILAIIFGVIPGARVSGA